MFSFEEKHKIAQVVENVIREINHPEMDNNNIQFQLHVEGKEGWSWADITENRKEYAPDSIWNENARRFVKEEKKDG